MANGTDCACYHIGSDRARQCLAYVKQPPIVRGQTSPLNRVAEYIWQKIDGKKPLSDIGNELTAAFEVPEDLANADLVEFVWQLSEAKLIVEKD